MQFACFHFFVDISLNFFLSEVGLIVSAAFAVNLSMSVTF